MLHLQLAGRPARTGRSVAVIADRAASASATCPPCCTICGSASRRTRCRAVTRTETFVGCSTEAGAGVVSLADVGPDHPSEQGEGAVRGPRWSWRHDGRTCVWDNGGSRLVVEIHRHPCQNTSQAPASSK